MPVEMLKVFQVSLMMLMMKADHCGCNDIEF
jgi:hypothetical protein